MAALSVLLVALTVAACKSAATPAADSGPAAGDDDSPSNASLDGQHEEGRALYERRCGTCHDLYAPDEYPAAAWPRYVKRYGPRSGLTAAQREKVTAYLQAAAGR